MKRTIAVISGTFLFAALICMVYTGCKKKEAAESCTDGIKNQTETGVDCGGPCTACASCSDGIQNQGETGIDCGGPCTPCPVATMSAVVDGTPWVATYTSCSNLSGTLAIQGTIPSSTKGISLAHSGTFAPGTYTLGSFDGNYAVSTPTTVNCIIQTGTITFTTFNTTTKTVSGTFSFNCTDNTTSVSQVITAGVFTNMKY